GNALDCQRPVRGHLLFPVYPPQFPARSQSCSADALLGCRGCAAGCIPVEPARQTTPSPQYLKIGIVGGLAVELQAAGDSLKVWDHLFEQRRQAMEFRSMGQTDLKCSVIGFGCGRIASLSTMHHRKEIVA